LRLEPGALIDRYVIEELLGQGGNASVYAVRHQDLGSRHAVKVLHSMDNEVRAKLVAEGRAQASVKHPNIVSVIDILDVSGCPGLLMELVDGPRLDTWITSTVFTVEQLDEIVSGIVAGVSAAHKAGLVHRDLKPSNIMIAIHEDMMVPKVMDFGLAKILNPGLSGSSTREGMTMGTPSYMAPEQIEDAKNVDLRADIFSLGAILYELSCGKRAFEGRNVIDIFTNIRSGHFVSPRQFRSQLPQRMEDAITAALIVNREDRVQDCSELLNIWHGQSHNAGVTPRSGNWSTKDLQYAYEVGQSDKTPAAAATQDFYALAEQLGGRHDDTLDQDVTAETKKSYADDPTLKIRKKASEWLEPERAQMAAIGVVLLATALAIGLGLYVGGQSEPIGLELAERDYQYQQLTFDGFVGSKPCVFDNDGSLVMVGAGRELFHFGAGKTETLPVEGGNVGEPDCGSNAVAVVRYGSDVRGIWTTDWGGTVLHRSTTGGYAPALSPDGNSVAFQSVPLENPLLRIETSSVYVSKIGSPGNIQLGSGDAVQPSWSPSGERVAYWSLENGNRALWTDAATGGDPVKVRTGNRDHWSPTWTDDGIYYLSDAGGVTKVWRVFVDQVSGQTLSSSEEIASGSGFTAWHLEANTAGTVLALEAVEKRNQLVWLKSEKGTWSDVIPIEAQKRPFERPEWSPSGDAIVAMTSSAREGILLIDVKTAEAKVLVDDGFRTRSPRWSPDGESIAFYSNRDGVYGVWRIGRDGSDLRKLSPEGFYVKPVWSPDGKHMVLHSSENISWLLNLENNSLELLSPMLVTWHSWSADGKYLAGWDADGVYIMNLETTSVERVYGKAALPVFYQGSERLLLAQNEVITELGIVDREKEDIVRVNGKSVVGMSVTADGERLVLGLSEREGAVWRLVDSSAL
jgi:serine/threonine protein kinase/Tol biopolymer transport system component